MFAGILAVYFDIILELWGEVVAKKYEAVQVSNLSCRNQENLIY